MFPGVALLKEKYTVLKKWPWMLPVVWVVRPFYKLIFERKSLKQQSESLEVLSEDNVENHRRLMNYVGLDYNFEE
jgi:hypothetical protein